MRTVTLTEEGNQRMEEMLEEAGLLTPDTSLYDVENVSAGPPREPGAARS